MNKFAPDIKLEVAEKCWILLAGMQPTIRRRYNNDARISQVGNYSSAVRGDAIKRSSNPNRTSEPLLEMQEMPSDTWTSNYKIHPAFRCKYN
jgi:hypothetical protein